MGEGEVNHPHIERYQVSRKGARVAVAQGILIGTVQLGIAAEYPAQVQCYLCELWVYIIHIRQAIESGNRVAAAHFKSAELGGQANLLALRLADLPLVLRIP